MMLPQGKFDGYARNNLAGLAPDDEIQASGLLEAYADGTWSKPLHPAGPPMPASPRRTLRCRIHRTAECVRRPLRRVPRPSAGVGGVRCRRTAARSAWCFRITRCSRI